MKAKNIIYSSIYFDCDSTLVDIEGVDELAGFYNKKEEVSRFTEKAMSGAVKLEDVFALKLAMIRPKRSDFEKLGQVYIQHIVEDAKELIGALQALSKNVIIMTGNFYPSILPLSRYLGIEDQNVFANQIYFDDNGNYMTFDSKGPLSVAGGKRSLMYILKRDEKKTVFIGDGATDMETRPPVDLFIGYGGVISRENVKDRSDMYITTRSMAPILSIVVTEDERKILLNSPYRKLLVKGDKLLSHYGKHTEGI